MCVCVFLLDGLSKGRRCVGVVGVRFGGGVGSPVYAVTSSRKKKTIWRHQDK